MKILGNALLLALASTGLSAGEASSETTEDVVRISVRGTLRHGLMAIGGETTGTTISADGMTFELDLGRSEELIAAAKRLDGKKAVAAGRLTRRAGVETGTRWVIEARRLQPAGQAPDEPGPEKGKPESSELKRLLSRAAGVDAKVLEVIARSAEQPKFSDFESQTLTAILLALPGDKDADAEKAKEFRYEARVKPADLFREIYRGKRLGPLELKPELATFLHEDRITDVEHERDGDALRGTVSFRAPGMYQGKVDFVARAEGDSWQVEEFSLPAHGIRTRLESSGRWKLVEGAARG